MDIIVTLRVTLLNQSHYRRFQHDSLSNPDLPYLHPRDVERLKSELAIYERYMNGSVRTSAFCDAMAYTLLRKLHFDYLPNGDLGRYLARTGMDAARVFL
jgi:hypothetical protein